MAGVHAPAAGAATCTTVPAYPGDGVKSGVAAWMATGASARGLPPELPVMAALVESGLANLDSSVGGTDSRGYFGMRTSIWNTGAYAGYPEDPALQVKWFLDQAQSVRAARVAAGDADFGGSPSQWGEWIADVERPAEQYRGRYQLRLEEAQALIATGCPAGPPGGTGPPATGPPPRVDRTAPQVRLKVAARQKAGGRRTLRLRLSCLDEACTATAIAKVTVAGRRGSLRLRSASAPLATGRSAVLGLAIPRVTRRVIVSALRRGRRVRARVTVAIADAAGNIATRSRTVRLV